MKKLLTFVFLALNLMAADESHPSASSPVARELVNNEPGALVIWPSRANAPEVQGTFGSTQNKPCCSFLFFLTLIAYDSGIFKGDPDQEIQTKDGDVFTPKTWFQKNSVARAREILHKLSVKSFIPYFHTLGYGNNDIADAETFGVKDIRDETNPVFWLSGILKISPIQQVEMLKKLFHNELKKADGTPFRKGYLEFIRAIFKVETPDDGNGWTIYGKTGAGDQTKDDGTESDLKLGWFVGWAEKDDEYLIFARYIHEDVRHEGYPSPRAMDQMLEIVSRF